MTTIRVTLSDELKSVVEQGMAEGGFDSPDAYLQSLVRDAQRRRAKRSLDAKIIEALDGEPATPMTREDWEAVEREALGRLDREQPRG